MMNDVKEQLARIIIARINRRCNCLAASKCDDFDSTCKITIDSLVSTPRLIGDFVWSKLSFFERSHLVFCGSDDPANVSYWKVV